MENNQINTFPIGNIELRELYLRNNKIAHLPKKISQLSQLRKLDLRGNSLEKLPKSLLKLANLERLDLRWNDRLVLPKWVNQLRAKGVIVYH